MEYVFHAMVSRGPAKGEVLEDWKDEDGNFVLFDPAKRRNGAAHAEDYVLVRSSEEAKRLIEEQGLSLRMRLKGVPSDPPRLISASGIRIIEVRSGGVGEVERGAEEA